MPSGAYSTVSWRTELTRSHTVVGRAQHLVRADRDLLSGRSRVGLLGLSHVGPVHAHPAHAIDPAHVLHARVELAQVERPAEAPAFASRPRRPASYEWVEEALELVLDGRRHVPLVRRAP